MTAVLPEITGPALAPETDKRAHVREWRRDLAEWLRGYGVTPTGDVWDLALAGERNLAVIRHAAYAAGTLARHWSGEILPDALVPGDQLSGGRVAGIVRDPETGAMWATLARVAGENDHDTAGIAAALSDHEMPGEVVPVTRGRGTR